MIPGVDEWLDQVPEGAEAGPRCLCSHPTHPGRRCPVRICGCDISRPLTAESWLESLAKAGPAIWAAKNAAREKAG